MENWSEEARKFIDEGKTVVKTKDLKVGYIYHPVIWNPEYEIEINRMYIWVQSYSPRYVEKGAVLRSLEEKDGSYTARLSTVCKRDEWACPKDFSRHSYKTGREIWGPIQYQLRYEDSGETEWELLYDFPIFNHKGELIGDPWEKNRDKYKTSYWTDKEIEATKYITVGGGIIAVLGLMCGSVEICTFGLSLISLIWLGAWAHHKMLELADNAGKKEAQKEEEGDQ